eukprot:TRINITY_DN1468_c0_g3_i1.p1 TRINITY_DN1468_c0_g3~~TRINITY_DN1468_c0_g3_i1.p1  ORF type:complete len:592 (+),score=75.07 TRINITY_DN1468_c0_g3_i1:233-2008(+)
MGDKWRRGCHHEYSVRISHYAMLRSSAVEDGFESLQVSRLPRPPQVIALLVPRTLVEPALRALGGMRPRWGELVARLATPSGGGGGRGVHVPDPRDESVAAVRAIELPPPLGGRIAQAAACLQTTSVAGTTSSASPELEREETLPNELLEILATDNVRVDVCFEPPPRLEDLHPCPGPTREWETLGAVTLPAHDASCAGLAPPMWGQRPDRFALKPFRFIELFAGIGGFRVGLETLGGECVFASEMHPTSRLIYQENWPSDMGVLAGDIRAVPAAEVPEHDLLTAGFPCQPFSNLGEQHGLDDNRGQLFLHICRVLRVRRPAAALLENVPGLLDVDGGRAMETVLQELRNSGYRVAHRVYNSQCLLPQKRKRVYIVAIRGDLQAACAAFRFPWLPDLGRVLYDALEHPEPAEGFDVLTLNKKRWLKMLHSRAFTDDPTDVIRPLDQPAAPLVSNYGSGAGRFVKYTQLVPRGPVDAATPPRRFSCRECARLQGFPESFKYSSCDGPPSWYRAIGNAVGPPMICALAGAVLYAVQHPERQCLMPATAPALRLALASGSKASISAILKRHVGLPGGEGHLSVAALLDALERSS